MRMFTSVKKICRAWLLLALAFTVCGTAWADFPAVKAFPHTGVFRPQLVRIKHDVAVISMDGNYNRDLADGGVNIEPRTEIAKEFLRTHADKYDFIVVFSNFEYNTKDALAFHIGVQNKVGGLGLEAFDNTAEFGSRGKLLGYIDMAALSRYNLNPYSTGFDRVLQVFAHEFLHQWGSHVKVRGPDGKPSDVLLGRDGAHWSFLLDSGASVEFGNQWQDNGNGTFTSVAGQQFFSPLDLYLMGMLKKEEVPPFFLIDSPAVDKKRLPENGVTISGSRRNLSIDDVIAVEGPRTPDAEHAQKEFRLGFVLLTRPGEKVSDEVLANLGAVRTAITTRLSVLTGGRALVQSYLEPKVEVAGPGTPPDTGPVRISASTHDGLLWLRKQSSGGPWRDNPMTAVRDTTVVLDTIIDADGVEFNKTSGLQWLRTQANSNTDYQARTIRALMRYKINADDAAAKLATAQNADGGWGVAPGYQSNALDTALALLALQPFDTSLAAGRLAPAASYLAARQNPDGGWGNLNGGVSRTYASAIVVQAMAGRVQGGDLLNKAKAFLASRQNPDGGFGDSPSTVHDTVNVMQALLAQNGLSAVRSGDAIAYVSSSQRTDGSWDGSAYSTALAVRLLKSSGLFNWTTAGMQAAPAAPTDGQSVILSFKVSNTGTTSAPAGVARLYDGDPATGGVSVGNDIAIPPLAIGGSVELQQVWSTFNKEGTHQLVLVVDPSGKVTESSKSDNEARIAVTVKTAPAGTELLLNASDITVTPAKPAKLPTVLGVSALISNIGKTDAKDVRVVLMQGQGTAARIVAEKQLNMLGRTQQVVNFSTTISQSGAYDYTVVIDPDNRISEQDKANNSAGAHVETAAALDLEVTQQDVSILSSPVYLGSDANFKIKLRNAGTQDSPPFKVRYTVSDGTNSVEAAVRTLQLASGMSTEEDLVWRTTMGGDLTMTVEIDPDSVLAESDRSNNAAGFSFRALVANGSNLAISFKELTVKPAPVLEGSPVQLSQVVRNTGNASANNIEVAFYDGDPAGGHMIGSLQTIPALAAGASATVSVQWPRFPDAAEHIVFVVVDPSNKQTELSRDDNSAFLSVSGSSLPDLAVSDGDLVLTPAAPRPGDPIDVAVKVANLGKQVAQGVVVRLYSGEPAQGGSQIGAEQQIAALAGGDSRVLHFAVPAHAAGGLNFVVVADPDQRIEEKTRANNTARLVTTVQDGDLFITERYFSPNGDGVKDSTMLSFRLKQLGDVSVQVLDKDDKVVRQFSGAGMTQVNGGSVSWDGVDERGALMADGSYRLRLLGKDGSVLGEKTTNVDTNRSPVLAALGTEFEYRRNLSCEAPYIDYDHQEVDTVYSNPVPSAYFTADENQVFMQSVEDQERKMRPNFWRAFSDGSNLNPLLSGALLEKSNWTNFSIAANGKLVAATRKPWDTGHYELWIMQGDGGNPRKLRDFGSDNFAGKLSSDGRHFLATVGGKRLRIPVDGSGEVILGDALAPRKDNQFDGWSPDGRLRAVLTKVLIPDGRRQGQNYIHVEVQDEDGKTVFSADTRRGRGDSSWQLATTGVTWADDSRHFGFGHSFAPVDCGNAGAGGTSSTEPCGFGHVFTLVDLDKRNLTPVAATRLPAAGSEGTAASVARYQFAPEGKSVIRTVYDREFCGTKSDLSDPCLAVIDLENGKIRSLFAEQASGTLGDHGVPRNFEIAGFLPSGRQMLFISTDASEDPASACYQKGADLYTIGSLYNLTADLRAVRGTSAALMLSGTASDLNFKRFRLEYATAEAPEDWKAIQPASATPVIDTAFTTWVPPGYGRYLVRLTVEDTAGNLRERVINVTWDDRPSITDVYKDNEFVSPNGDKVQDEYVLHYRVQEPVHLEFQVLDKNMSVVRSVSRDHFGVGIESSFVWDGRNDAGIAMPDGQYRVRLQDYEFFATLDRQAPAGKLEMTSAYGQLEPGLPIAWAVPKLIWKSSDNNYLSMSQEKGSGETPAEWSEVGRYPELASEGSSSLITRRGQELLMGDYINIQYRMTVMDKAGNQTVLNSGLAKQEVFLLANASHKELPGGRVAASEAFSYVEPGHLAAAWLPSLDRNLPIRLRVFESVRKPLAAVVVQFQDIPDPRKPLKPGESREVCETCWHEVAMKKFGVMKTAETFVATDVPRDGNFEMLWDASGLDRSKFYLVRVKLLDVDGAEATSLIDYILPPGMEDVHIVQIGGARHQRMDLIESVVTDEPVERVELRIKSQFIDDKSGPVDPRYMTERTIHTVYAPGFQLYNRMLDYKLLETLDLHNCATYQFQLVAYTVSGRKLESKPSWTALPPECLDISWVVKPVPAETCNATPSGKTQITLFPYDLLPRTEPVKPRLVQLQLGETQANGEESILNNWNDITDRGKYTFDLDTSALPAGMRTYFARLIDEFGNKVDVPVTVEVAHDAPTLRVTAPVAGKVCPVHDKDNRPQLAVEAEVISNSPIRYGVEWGGDPWQQTTCTENEERCLRADPVQTAHAGKPNPEDSPDAEERFLKEYHHPGYKAKNGEVGRIPLDPLKKSVTFRLHSFNAAGHNTCTAPVEVEYDAQVAVESLKLDRAVFSPFAAAPLSHTTLTITPDEDVTLDVEVVPAQSHGDGKFSATGPAVRTLAKGRTAAAGPTTIEWDGRDNNQQVVADGLYALRVTYWDGCQNQLVDMAGVIVDGTPPVLGIAAPAAHTSLGLNTSVTGSVRDVRLLAYELKFALASAPETWLPLATGNAPTADDAGSQLLANWNTYGLSGPATLRLSAIDGAGNQSKLDVPVTIGASGALLSAFEGSPLVFSPNGDGRVDAVSLRWSLLQPAKLTLEISPAAAAGQSIAVLLKDEAAEPGARAIAWDGKGSNGAVMADGKYLAKLVAVAVDGSGTTQEEVVKLVLDNTAPGLAFSHPKGEFATARGSAMVNVSDDNLESYKTYFSTAPANEASWQLASEGNVAANGLAAKSLEGLAEGSYALKVVAVDQAANRSDLQKTFAIDNTPPKPTLTAPADGSYLSIRKNPVAVRGKVEEANPASFALRLAPAGAGGATDLASGNGKPASELLANWDLSGLADGRYVLTLHAQDLAGLEADAAVTVTVDNTAPLAVITTPANGSYVRKAADIIGVARDENLQDYRIDIAPGGKAAAQRWSPLGSGSAAVDNAVLLPWKALPADGVHTLRLTVTDKAGNTSETMAEITVDTTPPAAPQGVRAVVEKGKDIRVSWTANTEPDLAGYIVYRDGQRLNQDLLQAAVYLDPGLDAGTYNYVVKAVDKAGWESEPSQNAPATISSQELTAAIYGPLDGARISASVDVTGTASAGKAFKEYRLYMGVGTQPSTWKLVRRSPVPTVADILGALATFGIAENEFITLKLEAEDLSGQVAQAQVAVQVDNSPPLAPTQLVGSLQGNNANLSWTASTSADVAGYLLWRNGKLANATGPVVGSLKPYLIKQTSFKDLKLPNGDYAYTVQAMDQAENLSPLSNTVQLAVHGTPHAVLAAPLNNAKVGDGVYLRATSADTDIASVEFQYRAASDGAWSAVAPAVAQMPFGVKWNNAGLPFGDYQLQVIATSKFGLVDPAPTPILVHLGDYRVPELSAKVKGNAVTLTWQTVPSGASGLVIQRTGARDTDKQEWNLDASARELVDTDVAPGAYAYTIRAKFADGTEGASSNAVPVLVYAPVYRQPYTPTAEASFQLQASAVGRGQLLLVRRVEGQPDLEMSIPTADDGKIVQPVLPVELGENRFELTHMDGQGNESMMARFRVVRGAPPAQPRALTVSRNTAGTLSASWLANAEGNIAGYGVALAGERSVAPLDLWECEYSSMTRDSSDRCPSEERTDWTWTPDPELGLADAWYQVSAEGRMNFSRFTTQWLAGSVAADFDIEGWSGQEWVPLASVRGNARSRVDSVLPQPYRSDRVRVKLMPTEQGLPTMTGFSVTTEHLAAGTHMEWAGALRGVRVEVAAQNELGLFGPAAARTEGDTDSMPPTAVVLSGSVNGSQVRLAWTASQAADVARYEVRMDGSVLGETPGLTFNTELKNGLYQFNVVAIDADGNRSPASNTVALRVDVAPAAAPVNLAAQAQGGGIALAWGRPSADMLVFRVLRATQPGGAYAVVAEQIYGLSFLDTSAVPGTRYYYVVVALDGAGNAGKNSNEADATMAEPDLLAAPVLFAPTIAGMPVSTRQPAVEVVANAVPGAQLSLLRDGQVIATAATQAQAGSDKVKVDAGTSNADASPDGRSLLAVGQAAYLLDFAAKSATPVPVLDGASAPRWSHDGRSIAFVDTANGGQVQTYVPGTGAVVAVGSLSGAQPELAWSPNDSTLAVAAPDGDGNASLWLLTVADGSQRQLVVGNGAENYAKLAWSPDGKSLAWTGGAGVRLAAVTDGAVTALAGDRQVSALGWSRDGATLLVSTVDGDAHSVSGYTVANGQAAELGVYGRATGALRTVPANDGFFQVEDGRLVQRSSKGEYRAQLADDVDGSAALLASGNGYLMYRNRGQQWVRLSPAGTARFGYVQLQAGLNRLTARSGGQGSPSAPVDVTLVDAFQPNLALTEDDFSFDKDVLEAGKPVRLGVAVHNTGTGDAGAFTVVLSAADANGGVTALGSRAIGRLAAGQQQLVEADWTPALAGSYSIAAEIQAPAVAESSTDDNRAVKAVVVVAPVPAPVLSVQGVPAGSALALSWVQPAAEAVTSHRVRRATAANGPFDQLGYARETQYVDHGAKNGVRYYYVVTALDADGRDRATSNVASGMAQDTVAPEAPVVLSPASAGMPATLAIGSADIDVSAEPGATVTLVRGGREAGQGVALREYGSSELTLPRGSRLVSVSANGGKLVYETNNEEFILLDRQTAATRKLELGEASNLSLSPDGKVLAYSVRRADGNFDMRSLQLDGGTANTLATFYANVSVAQWSADSRHVMFTGAQVPGQIGAWQADLASGKRSLLADNVSDPAMSKDGQYLAFTRDSALQVIKASDGSPVAGAEAEVSDLSWSLDGKLLFVQSGADHIGELKEMTVPGGAVQTLLKTSAPYALRGARWAGAPGHFLATVEDDAAFYSHEGFRLTERDYRLSSAQEIWTTRNGQVFVDRQFESALRYDPAGLVTFKGVTLKEGDNIVSAYAVDADGRRGADALPAHILYNPAPQPDLAAGENDIVVLPAAPLLGESARVTAVVRNAGSADAANVGVALVVRDPQGGLTTLASSSLASLAAGASEPVTADWKPAVAGVHTFVLTLDAANTVVERDEFNNTGVRTVRVAEYALPQLVVRTDAARYGSNAPVAGTILLSNAGPAVSGRLALRVEDAQGYLAATLPEQAVPQLATAQELTLGTSWNTGSYLAGDYRLVGELVDADGKVLQRASAAFSIGAERQANATLAVDRGQYTAGQDVRLSGTVQLAAANAQLDGASAVLQVVASDDSVVWSTTLPIGTLLPGAAADVAATWNLGSAAAGNYRARLKAFAGGSQLASAETTFVVVDASATASLSGELSLSSLAVSNGDRLAARYTLNNAGNRGLAGVPLAVIISRADNGTVLASVPAQADIAARGQTPGEAGFEVAAWPLTTLQVVLQATLDGRPVTLQRATLRVIDRLAPTLAWVAPGAGSIVGGAEAAVVAKAADSESQVASVEVAVDDGAWRGMAPRKLSEGLYGSPLQGLADGAHNFRARATDSFGNVSTEAVLNLVVDNTAPVISISGVEEGGRYPAAVTPVASTADAHLSSVLIMLDNAAFASGTPVSAPGQHTLQVTARDLAGNSATRSVSFTLASAAPELSGTLQANPAQVEVGASVALSGTVHNGATPAPGTRIDLSVANSATGAVLFQSSDSVDLAANGSWTLDRGWRVAGPANTSYLATLTATAGGSSSVLAQAGFTAVEPLPVLDVQQSAGNVGRVLVLSMCKRSMYANLGRCGAAPITGDAATTLLLCDSNRAKTIDQFLDGLGVPHKTVTKESDFAKELRSGAYSSYWISGGATKLRQPLTSELRNGLYLGEALVADGMHDLRQADRALDSLLGVQYSGRFAANAVPKLSLTGQLFGKSVLPVLGDAYTLQGQASTTAEGLFLRDASQSASIAWDEDGCGSAAPTAGPEVQICPAPGSTSGADAGVLSGSYGQGRTLLFGFDFAASCTAQGADPAWQATARSSFDWLNQPQAEPSGTVVAGDTVVRRTSLHNSGMASSVNVTVQLPAGAKLLDSKPAAQLTSGASGDLLSWPLTLDGGADAQLELRLQAPLAAGSYQLHYSVSTVSGGSTKVLSSQDVGLQVVDLAAAGPAAADAVALLDSGTARSDAMAWLARARASATAGSYERALREAATAQARLEQLGSNATAAQQALARLVRAIERRM
ncbi:CARDB domain-containing protein [Duganella sp. Root336D2]|uniref:CARDB domain-containing protein n=1 Tax=Duganella sp. Root336D2 TaxID=1736518 RepID=UPI0009E973CA|nr:CARDB domain-containing protein [Duganella sp. Root336D2]